MKILFTSGWEDYELLDSGDEHKLERFGEYTLLRPDPQAIWQPKSVAAFDAADVVFENGRWIKKKELPQKWLMKYKDLTFYVKLSPFKHTGVFPEQSLHWDFIQSSILNPQNTTVQPNILNLFAYTGIASLAAASAGAKVTHVDASYPTIGWAKENQQASKLEDKPIRWILDDAIKFVQREVKRDVKYDGIIMDPPVFGHGPEGQVWKFNESFPKLLKLCKEVLSDHPLFIIVNAYAISSSALMLENVLKDLFGNLGGEIESGELALQEKKRDRLLSTGIFARWSR